MPGKREKYRFCEAEDRLFEVVLLAGQEVADEFRNSQVLNTTSTAWIRSA
jgi:hypothetical protein